jgi:hypothetical protein
MLHARWRGRSQLARNLVNGICFVVGADEISLAQHDLARSTEDHRYGRSDARRAE